MTGRDRAADHFGLTNHPDGRQHAGRRDTPAQNVDPIAKVCPLCAEQIKAAAKVCPYCRASETRLARWGPYFLVALSGSLMLAVVGLACWFLFPDAFRREERSFHPYRSQMVVGGTTLERGQDKPGFWVTGFITNLSAFPWRVEELEARILDREGKLVDVCHERLPEKFVVPPRHEQAFRVGLPHLMYTNRGSVARIRVAAATDGSRAAEEKEH